MKIDICQRGESTEVEVPDGLLSVGGASDDALKIDGLPPRLVDLRVDAGRVTLCPRETLSVQGVLIPRNVPRLLLPGEKVALTEEVELRIIAPKPPAQTPGTAAVLKQLLGGLADPEAPKAASLTCLTGMDMGRRFYLAGNWTLIGRGREAQVQLRDRAVSRSHLRVRKGASGYYVEDMGSPNGAYVNGSRLRTIRVLNEGDILELGRSLLRFTGPFVDPPPPEPAPATPTPAKPSRRRRLNSDWALIGMGAALALAGLFVGWGVAG